MLVWFTTRPSLISRRCDSLLLLAAAQRNTAWGPSDALTARQCSIAGPIPSQQQSLRPSTGNLWALQVTLVSMLCFARQGKFQSNTSRSREQATQKGQGSCRPVTLSTSGVSPAHQDSPSLRLQSLKVSRVCLEHLQECRILLTASPHTSTGMC